MSIECNANEQIPQTFRFTNNQNGFSNSPKICDSGFALLQAKYQNNFGIVDSFMKCAGRQAGEGTYSTKNTNGEMNPPLFCYSGYVITGLEVRDSSEQGIVNFKILCGFFSVPGIICLT